jgi:hypothetical protein
VNLEQITQASLDAYNDQTLDAYCAFFTDDVVVADINGAVTSSGIDAYRERYAGTFAKFPNNKAELVNRIALGNTVIDHERVDRGDGVTPAFEVAAIYTFRDGKIARVDFAK